MFWTDPPLAVLADDISPIVGVPTIITFPEACVVVGHWPNSPADRKRCDFRKEYAFCNQTRLVRMYVQTVACATDDGRLGYDFREIG